ncbi:MAG: hypothetical protein K2M47_01785 [Clostridiales bacterium]|nr:hypothetical protein [Clostridiales bacterium]
MQGISVNAIALRDKANLYAIPNNKPGYYKWWAGKGEILNILSKLNMQFDDIVNSLEQKDGKYCIYVGVAIKESLRKRLNWHVNDKHTDNRVKNGTVSTLRKSIASLVGDDASDKAATNEFIDRLDIEYYLSDNPIKSQEAIVELHTIERSLLSGEYLYILNIQENRHDLAPKQLLKQLRKQAKIKALSKQF